MSTRVSDRECPTIAERVEFYSNFSRVFQLSSERGYVELLNTDLEFVLTKEVNSILGSIRRDRALFSGGKESHARVKRALYMFKENFKILLDIYRCLTSRRSVRRSHSGRKHQRPRATAQADERKRDRGTEGRGK